MHGEAEMCVDRTNCMYMTHSRQLTISLMLLLVSIVKSYMRVIKTQRKRIMYDEVKYKS